MGRPREPTRLKILRGNPGKRDVEKQLRNEPKPGLANLDPPETLEGLALEMWHRKAPQLLAMGVFTIADRETLERYCIAWELYCEAYRALKADGMDTEIGSGRRVVNPATALLRGYHADMLKVEREFGCTPAARSGMSVDNGKKESSLEAFTSYAGG